MYLSPGSVWAGRQPVFQMSQGELCRMWFEVKACARALKHTPTYTHGQLICITAFTFSFVWTGAVHYHLSLTIFNKRDSYPTGQTAGIVGMNAYECSSHRSTERGQHTHSHKWPKLWDLGSLGPYKNNYFCTNVNQETREKERQTHTHS